MKPRNKVCAVTEKTCLACGKTKNGAEFYFRMCNGTPIVNARCKPCVRNQNAKWVANRTPAQIRAKHVRAYQARAAHPEKRAAVRLVAYTIERGRMVRPTACEHCQGVGRIHGHHDDYSKPLDVLWLCAFCHKKRHKHLDDIKMRLLGMMEPTT